MSRIVILGCAGSGKAALARELGKLTRVPVISLDAIWEPHWGVKDVPAFRALLKKSHAGDEWISEGNFAVAMFDIRLPWATLVIGSIAQKCCAPGVIWHFDRVNRPRIEALRISHGADVPVRRLTGSATLRTFCRLTATELPIQF